MDHRSRSLVSAAALLLAHSALAQSSHAQSAQSAHTPHVPIFRAQTITESVGQSACALSTSVQLGTHWQNASIHLLSGPINHSGARRVLKPAVAFDVASPAGRDWRLRASASVGAAEESCGSPSAWSRGWLQLERAFGPHSVALSAGARSLSAADPTVDREGLTLRYSRSDTHRVWGVDVRAHVNQHLAMQIVSRTISFTDSVRNDTTGGWNRFNRTRRIEDSALAQSRSNTFSLRAHLRQVVGPVAVSVSGGASSDVQSIFSSSASVDSSIGGAPEQRRRRILPWAKAGVMAPLSDDVNVSLALAVLPAPAIGNARTARVASVGVSLATGKRRSERAPSTGAAFEMIRLPAPHTDSVLHDATDSSTVRIRFRSVGAKRVEVSGEPFAWQPIALRKSPNGWWEADVRMIAGTYRMSVRVDGSRWTAPPGYPAMRDEFGGDVALVTVR